MDMNLMDPNFLKNRMLEKVPGYVDNREGTFIYDALSLAANEIGYQYFMLQQLWESYFADTAVGEYLDRLSSEVGLTRKKGNKAIGVVQLTGNGNVNIGDIFTTANGLEFLSLEEKIINGVDTVKVEAAELGARYNLPPASIVAGGNWDKVTNEEATKDGLDPENDEELRIRLLDRCANPPASGCKTDYELWAKELSYIDYVKVLPLWAGNGTVKVVVGGDNGLPITSQNLNECTTIIKEKAPIGATVTVVNTQLYNVQIDIQGLQISTKADQSVVRLAIKTALENYFNKTIPSTTIKNLKIASVIINIDGVENFTSLTINGMTGDVMITEEQKPYLTNVVFN